MQHDSKDWSKSHLSTHFHQTAVSVEVSHIPLGYFAGTTANAHSLLTLSPVETITPGFAELLIYLQSKPDEPIPN